MAPITAKRISGRDLARERELLGLTQLDAARALGVHRTRVAATELLAYVNPRLEARFRTAIGEASRRKAALQAEATEASAPIATP